MSNSSTDRIVTELETWIAGATAGQKLPTSRQLMEKFSASPVTVRNAVHALAKRGLVETRTGIGVFVRARSTPHVADFSWQVGALGAPTSSLPSVSPAQRSAAPEAIALHTGYPDKSILPASLVRTALAKAAKNPTAFTRAPVRGLPELQDWFAAELGAFVPAAGAPPSPRDVLVVPGTQSGLSAIFRSMVGRDQPLVMESPTYWGAIHAARQSSAQIVPVASDAEGPLPAELDKVLTRTGARAMYAQPHFGNPRGISWSVGRQQEILTVLAAHHAFLIEDDWAHDYWLERPQTPLAAADTEGRVIYLRSLTKSVSPAVRVGAVIARGPVLDRIVADVAAEAMYTSGILQSAALEVVSQRAWELHLDRVRGELRSRRDELLAALDANTPSVAVQYVPTGGFNAWVGLPAGVNPDVIARDCEGRGLILASGNGWFPTEPTGPYLRLNFAGRDPQRYHEAAHILQAAIEAQS